MTQIKNNNYICIKQQSTPDFCSCSVDRYFMQHEVAGRNFKKMEQGTKTTPVSYLIQPADYLHLHWNLYTTCWAILCCHFFSCSCSSASCFLKLLLSEIQNCDTFALGSVWWEQFGVSFALRPKIVLHVV